MNFDYSDEQQQLADSLRKYLAQDYGFDKRKAIVLSARGVSDAAWATFAEMGLMAHRAARRPMAASAAARST